MKSIILFFILFFSPLIIFPKDKKVILNESIEAFITKKKVKECMIEINRQRAELFTCRVNLELEKIRRVRDVKLLQLKASKLVDRIYNFAFLAFIGFSFGFYAFRKQRDE